MTILELKLRQEDYSRSWDFVVGHLRRLGLTQTSTRAWSIISTIFYVVPLFVIETAPNGLDEHTRTLLRISLLALIIVPILFGIGVYRLRKADARALQPLSPSPEELVRLEATSLELSIKTATFAAQIPWSAASLFVIDNEFAVILAPRMLPIPITRSGSTTEEEFYLFLRHSQQYKAASED